MGTHSLRRKTHRGNLPNCRPLLRKSPCRPIRQPKPLTAKRTIRLPEGRPEESLSSSRKCRRFDAIRHRFDSSASSWASIGKTLFQRIRGGSLDRKSLFVTFHEGLKAMNIPLIRSYRLAIVFCKDFAGKIGFQRLFLYLMEHIGGKQCDSPCAAFACGLHHGNGNIHRRCHHFLTHFLCFEEATVTKNPVDLHLLLFKEDIHSDLQRTECREQMRTHEVRK